MSEVKSLLDGGSKVATRSCSASAISSFAGKHVMNMSYCRFENTLADLRDCQDAMEQNQPVESEFEKKARAELIQLCKEIAQEFGDEIEAD